jgi:hypothetical protein
MTIPLYYEAPLVLIVLLLVYFIFQNYSAYRSISSDLMKKIYLWLVLAAVFFILWGVDHAYNDLVPKSAAEAEFAHFFISHGFLLAVVICLAKAGAYIGEFGKKFGFGKK